MTSARTRRLSLLLLALALGALTGCSTPAETGRHSLTVITEQDHVLDHEQTLVGDLVVAGGTVTLAEGAELRGSVTVLAGEAAFSGLVVGDLTVLGGTAALTGTAEVTGDVATAGGTVTRDPAAVVRGDVTDRSGPAAVLGPGERAGSPAERLVRALLGTAVMAGLAWLVARSAPRPLQRTSAAATGFPVVSGALGVLVLVTALPLVVSMVVTLLLVPVAVLVLLGLAATIIYGLLATGRDAGRRIVRRLGWEWSTPAAAALGTAVLVAALQLVGLVPVVGAAVVGIVAAVCVGAVALTGFGLRWYTPPGDRPPDRPGTVDGRTENTRGREA